MRYEAGVGRYQRTGDESIITRDTAEKNAERVRTRNVYDSRNLTLSSTTKHRLRKKKKKKKMN